MLPPERPGDVGASSQLVEITLVEMRGKSGRGEEVMRSYGHSRIKKR